MLHPCRFEHDAWGRVVLLFSLVISRIPQAVFFTRNEHAVLLEVGLVFEAVVLSAVRKEREVSLQVSRVEVGK